MSTVDIRHFHLFVGLGGGARGFNRGCARVGQMQASFRCIGGVDVDPGAVHDFERLAGTRGTVLDMFDREQYIAFHGREPGPEWREAAPDDIRRAAGGERPHIVFLSAPCKGFSGLLSETKSLTAKYQALNRLTLRGVWLMLEAWADDPPELVLFENVPRLATRGRALLERITAMLRGYGYATAETTHDCGEIGGLAQSRKRFLLVARHLEKVPPLLYEPTKRPLRAVGEVLDRLPLPGHANAMHRVPALQWKTWARLALVEAGTDWRSLNKLAVKDGVLRDFLILPTMHVGGNGASSIARSALLAVSQVERRPGLWRAPLGRTCGHHRRPTGPRPRRLQRGRPALRHHEAQQLLSRGALGARGWHRHRRRPPELRRSMRCRPASDRPGIREVLGDAVGRPCRDGDRRKHDRARRLRRRRPALRHGRRLQRLAHRRPQRRPVAR